MDLPCFDDVDGGCDERGGEPGRDGRGEVAGHAVSHQPAGDQLVFDHVVHHDLAHVDDCSAANVRKGSYSEREARE